MTLIMNFKDFKVKTKLMILSSRPRILKFSKAHRETLHSLDSRNLRRNFGVPKILKHRKAYHPLFSSHQIYDTYFISLLRPLSQCILLREFWEFPIFILVFKTKLLAICLMQLKRIGRRFSSEASLNWCELNFFR